MFNLRRCEGWSEDQGENLQHSAVLSSKERAKKGKGLDKIHWLLSFSEGVCTLGPASTFFVWVWHPIFVDPDPAPALLSNKMDSSERHPLLSGTCSQW